MRYISKALHVTFLQCSVERQPRTGRISSPPFATAGLASSLKTPTRATARMNHRHASQFNFGRAASVPFHVARYSVLLSVRLSLRLAIGVLKFSVPCPRASSEVSLEPFFALALDKQARFGGELLRALECFRSLPGSSFRISSSSRRSFHRESAARPSSLPYK